ncbi:MAG TPA: glycosyltransferase [Thermoanaerobaculia bacterium]
MSRADRPPLTVFTPFYKTDPRYVDQTVASVLAQSFGDFEYILVNDGPAEDSRRLELKFRDPRLRVITSSPRGISVARNIGLNEGRGELIAFIDADDICEPDRFSRQIEFLRVNADHVLVGSSLRFIDEESHTIGHRSYPETDDEIKKRLVAFNCIAQPAVMARRQSLIDAGGYSSDFPAAEDYGLWLRLARFGKFHNFREPLVGYRIHLSAAKYQLLRPALRDSTKLKIHAIRHLGFKPTPRALASIAAHLVLLALPSPVVYWIFKRTFVR